MDNDIDEILENLRSCLGTVPMDYHFQIQDAVVLIEKLKAQLELVNKKEY